jgi:glycosyltransferase involved in cell wall biosynthesis
MGGGRKIGLLFENYGEHWTGGEYYLFNIIRSFQYFNENLPHFVIFYSNALVIEKVKELKYKGPVTFKPVTKPVFKPLAFVTRLFEKIFRIDLQIGASYPSNTVDFIFPCIYASIEENISLKKLRKVYWIPDFQHKYLPAFFSSEELSLRDANIEALSKLDATIVFSSNDVKDDFTRFFKEHKSTARVIRFASVLISFSHLSIEELRKKYALSEKSYFISPNQFWAHKNHIVILKAVTLLKAEGFKLQVVFTGKEQDYRNPKYTMELKDYVAANKIENMVAFLGFIDRAEQLQLMNHAQAVIQPSLFEGWSTVVEDAKALNKTLILSDLEVHREQCGNAGNYFSPENASELALYLKSYLNSPPKQVQENYQKNIERFANDLLRI